MTMSKRTAIVYAEVHERTMESKCLEIKQGRADWRSVEFEQKPDYLERLLKSTYPVLKPFNIEFRFSIKVLSSKYY